MTNNKLTIENGQLATVEVKAWDEALMERVGQAKDYASKLATDARRPSCHLWGLKLT